MYRNIFSDFFFPFLIFGCIGSSLLHAGFSLVAVSGGYSLLWCAGFSLQWLLLLQSTGSRHADFSSCGTRAQQLRCLGSVVGLSRCGSRALKHRLSSCGARAQLLHGMWDLPRPRMEPVSPAVAGGFLTAAPRGKSHMCVLSVVVYITSWLCSLNLP